MLTFINGEHPLGDKSEPTLSNCIENWTQVHPWLGASRAGARARLPLWPPCRSRARGPVVRVLLVLGIAIGTVTGGYDAQ